MIRIIAEGMHDTAHAIFEANEIAKTKPDAVFFELPHDVFQPIINSYSTGKIDVHQLKTQLFGAINKEEKFVDHELLSKFIIGKIEKDELDVIESEGREVHVMQAAKEQGAQMYAIDLSMKDVDLLLQAEIREEQLSHVRRFIVEKDIPPIVWKLSDILHFPYYLVERIIHHRAIATTNPFRHNVNTCQVCKLGVKWDRMVNGLFLPILNILPLSKELKKDLKIAYVIQRIDYVREQHMALRMVTIYKQLEKTLGREPNVIAIMHLWNAVRLENLIREYMG